MKIALIAACVLLVAGCSSASPPPTTTPVVVDLKAVACKSMQSLSPGVARLDWAFSVLADTNTTSADRLEALKVSLEKGGKEVEPCSGKVFEHYFFMQNY